MIAHREDTEPAAAEIARRSQEIEARLRAAGVELPEPANPVANYVPFVRTGNLLYVSGQISTGKEGLIRGKLGADLDIEAGQAAARQCALQLIAQMRAALGELGRVSRVVRLGAFVSATADFTDIAQVVNGASDLMVDVFAEIGRHARAAVACPVLPLDAAVEIDAIVGVTDAAPVPGKGIR